jgi:acetylornithine deacetylase/succinyl-diaminopimelate desuccinylase-like protein
VPKTPKTTYNVGILTGGTSVNTIPETVSAEIDMRSESADSLAALERSFLAILPRAAEAENKARSTSEGPITFEAKPVGDRPAGQTPESADIVRFAAAAYRAEGVTLTYHSASTDSNLPISLGIPAVTMARVATGGRAHAPDEWIGIEKGPNVKLKRILLATILATAGMR